MSQYTISKQVITQAYSMQYTTHMNVKTVWSAGSEHSYYPQVHHVGKRAKMHCDFDNPGLNNW